MATKLVTNQWELVLHLSIPIAEPNNGARAAWQRRQQPAGSAEVGATGSDRDRDSRCGGTQSTASSPSSPHRCHNRFSPETSEASISSGHNQRQSGANSVSFEVDQISPTRLRWMSPVPPEARNRLLLTIEPPCMARGRLNGFKDEAKGSKQRGKGGAGIIEDFCINFSRDLLKKLRESKIQLLTMASRTRCLMYIRKTLLLRSTRWTKSWTKHFMCRVYCTKRTLLHTFYRMLEQFDSSFCARNPCSQNRPRVTLVPNSTVPENTFLRMTRQRLRSCSKYFGKMPLLPDPHLTKLAAKLDSNCVVEASLLRQRVSLE